MKYLFRIAFAKKKRLPLLLGTAFAMVLATFSSQVEMLSLSLLNPRSIDVFELFSPREDQNRLKKNWIDERWSQLDHHQSGTIERRELEELISPKIETGLLSTLTSSLRSLFYGKSGGLHLIGFFLVISLARGLCSFLQTYLSGRLYLQIWQELCQQYFSKLQQMPLSYHSRQTKGQMVSRISHDAAACASAVNSLMTNYWQTPLLVASSLIYLYCTSPVLFALVFIELPFLGGIIFVFTKKIRKVVRQIQIQRDDSSSLLIEFLTGIETVKMYVAEAFTAKRYENANNCMMHFEKSALRFHLVLRPLIHFFCTLFFVGIIIWGIFKAHIELGDLLGYCGLIYLIYEQIKKIADENASIQRGAVAAEQVCTLIDSPLITADDPNAINLAPFARAITFEDVGFRHEGVDHWALRHLSLSIEKGSFTAFVGATGAGKSTLIQLISRLYETEEGNIFFDDINIRRASQRSLRSQIAYVPQQPFLFSDTISANIALGREISQQRIEWACQKAHIADFIQSTAMGYQTKLLEGGRGLSGGQQQRLAIARALAGDASILIFDEATSALDPLTESCIRASLEELKGYLTLVIIAHRLFTIERADQIYFLQNGSLLARGSQSDLMKICPPFRAMWEAMKGDTSAD